MPGRRKVLARRNVDTATCGRPSIISLEIENILSARKERKEFSEIPMMHLDPQLQQLGGFALGRRVFGPSPKMPIGAVDNPHFSDAANPTESPTTKTHRLLGIIHQIPQASSAAYFNGN